MVNHLLPVLASIYNFTVCLENILEKGQFETIGLVHMNTTADLADSIHGQLMRDTNYAWMRFNMASTASASNILKDNLFKNIFFVYFLDDFVDWGYVYKFIIISGFNYRDNHIYVVNKYPTFEYISEVGKIIFQRHFFNSVVLFWNTSGHGSGLEAYTYYGLRQLLQKIPTINDHDQCKNIIYDLIFADKFSNFNRINLTIYGQTSPPRIVSTVATIGGQLEYSMGGHDVLIMEAISKHLNATPQFKFMLIVLFGVSAHKYDGDLKPSNNTEHRTFNVTEISRFNWTIPRTNDENNLVYGRPSIDMNSQQMRHNRYMETLRLKDYTYLYPHDTDNFIVVVPKRFKSKTEYDQILKSPLFLVWAPVTLIATIIRYTFNKIMKADNKNLIDIYLQMFGLSLGMSFNSTRSSVAEKLLLWWFCLGTMLSGMLLSSSMFQGFALQLDTPSINNLKELEMSGLEVQVPAYTETVEMFFANIPEKLKLNYTLDYAISEMIYNRNTSNAYVIREGKFNVLFSNDNEMWHVIERFGFEHLSYRLRFFSSVEDRMNTVIQRSVDHGIVKYLVAKNKRLLAGIQPKAQSVISTIVQPISVNDIKQSFLLYALGIVFCTITLIAERIYFSRTMVSIEQIRIE